MGRQELSSPEKAPVSVYNQGLQTAIQRLMSGPQSSIRSKEQPN
jgi:hypothetical protein